ncbi:hypothetical protein [Streptomyces sp. NPDC053427]|uniref:hypothetical protein n=1 Tax=Streptomyces sp. NPDC053427 TaxID=3365701 RepID=UPI0037CD46E6
MEVRADEESRELTAALRGILDPLIGCPDPLRPASQARADLERQWESASALPPRTTQPP